MATPVKPSGYPVLLPTPDINLSGPRLFCRKRAEPAPKKQPPPTPSKPPRASASKRQCHGNLFGETTDASQVFTPSPHAKGTASSRASPHVSPRSLDFGLSTSAPGSPTPSSLFLSVSPPANSRLTNSVSSDEGLYSTRYPSSEDAYIKETGAPIGFGTTARVYKVKIRGSPDSLAYALRISTSYSDSLSDSFRMAQEVLSGHPNVLPILHSWRSDDGWLCVLTEFCEMSLSRLLKSDWYPSRPDYHLPLDVVLKMSAQIASGIEYIHSFGLAHSDIKPENILVQHVPALPLAPPLLKIADFGTLTEQKSPADDSGDYRYLAPEAQLGSSELADPQKIDLYAIGMTIFEIFFDVELSLESCRLLQSSFDPLSPSLFEDEPRQLPTWLQTLLTQLLGPPDSRPPASEVLAILNSVLSELPESAIPTHSTPHRSSRSPLASPCKDDDWDPELVPRSFSRRLNFQSSLNRHRNRSFSDNVQSSPIPQRPPPLLSDDAPISPPPPSPLLVTVCDSDSGDDSLLKKSRRSKRLPPNCRSYRTK